MYYLLWSYINSTQLLFTKEKQSCKAHSPATHLCSSGLWFAAYIPYCTKLKRTLIHSDQILGRGTLLMLWFRFYDMNDFCRNLIWVWQIIQIKTEMTTKHKGIGGGMKGNALHQKIFLYLKQCWCFKMEDMTITFSTCTNKAGALYNFPT